MTSAPGGRCAPATGYGFGDFANPDNPFKDWHLVFVPYCTCDLHWGNKRSSYPGLLEPTPVIEHRGRINALFAEKWAREHFVNPDQVFVTGSSAGGMGAVLNGTHLHEVYPSSRFGVLSDAGNGVSTQDFLEGDITSWFVEPDLPRHIPALDVDALGAVSISDIVIEAASYYEPRNSRYAVYVTSWDYVQTQFFNVMAQTDLGAQAEWRNGSCGWNDAVLYLNDLLLEGDPENVRIYIGPGSDHIIWYHPKTYTEAVTRVDGNGSETFVDWVSDMLADPPGDSWANVECVGSECDHVCQDWVDRFTCDGDPTKHQDESTDPLPDCDGAGTDIQACCQAGSVCEDVELTFCRFLGGEPQGEATECATVTCP